MKFGATTPGPRSYTRVSAESSSSASAQLLMQAYPESALQRYQEEAFFLVPSHQKNMQKRRSDTNEPIRARSKKRKDEHVITQRVAFENVRP